MLDIAYDVVMLHGTCQVTDARKVDRARREGEVRLKLCEELRDGLSGRTSFSFSAMFTIKKKICDCD